MRQPCPLLSGLLAALLLASTALSQDLTQRLEARAHVSEKHGSLPYRIFAPPAKRGQKLPLVIFLHGAGERGDDNARQLVHGVRDLVSEKSQARHSAIVVAPQCPKGVWWTAEPQQAMLLELVDDLTKRNPIDVERLYVTGLSMGGYGTWSLAARAPDKFAAAIPICGRGDVKTAPKLVNLPLWVFHGADDNIVSVQFSRVMVDALRAAGGHPKYTEYEGVRHDSWTRTYANPEVHDWLFAQRRGRAPKPGLKAEDRVVFFGDSITWSGARGKGYIRLMEADLKQRKLGATLIGAGISGNKVPDLLRRLDADVLAKKPTIVMIYIGINDVWHSQNGRGTKKPDFDSGLRELVQRITAAGARVILCTPSVIGEKTDGTNRFDEMLAEYAAISRKVAADTGTQLLDLRHRFSTHLAEHNEKNAEKGLLTTDGVHLNAAGNRFVADCMLEALGVGR